MAGSDRSDYGGACAAAALAGPAAMVAIMTMYTGLIGQDPLGGLGAGVFFALFSIPVWLFGVAIFGLPIWLILERVRVAGPIAAAGLGAVLVGGIWFTFASGWAGIQSGNSDFISEALLIGGTGAASGAAAGLAGWVVGRRKRPIASRP